MERGRGGDEAGYREWWRGIEVVWRGVEEVVERGSRLKSVDAKWPINKAFAT